MPGTRLSGRKKMPTRELQIMGSRWAKGRTEMPETVAIKHIEAAADYNNREREIFKFYSQCLINLRILSAGDIALLDTFTRVYAELLELEEDIKEHGRTYKTETGEQKTRPECRLRNEARREIRSLSAQLGLSPSSRGGIEPIKTENQNPFAGITA